MAALQHSDLMVPPSLGETREFDDRAAEDDDVNVGVFSSVFPGMAGCGHEREERAGGRLHWHSTFIGRPMILTGVRTLAANVIAHFLVGVVALSGCSSPRRDPTPTVAPSAGATAPAPLPSAPDAATDATAAAGDAETARASAIAVPPPREKSGCPEAAFRRALGQGRALALRQSFEAATKAFDEAVHLRPLDAQARAERGHAELRAGRLDAALSDLSFARSRQPPAPLLAQIWFNLGLLHEAKHDDERARTAFAWADSIAASPAVEAKLAGRSPCRVAIVPGSPLSSAPASRRRELCQADDGTDACTGPGPWSVSRGTLDYHRQRELVAALADGSLVHTSVFSAGGNCRGGLDGELTSSSGLLFLRSEETDVHLLEDRACVPDEASANTDGSMNECSVEPEPLHTLAVYDAATGRPRVELESYTLEVRAEVEGGALHVRAPGCDERVTLDGAAKPF